MMSNSQQPRDPQDQVLFTVDAETFRQFYELLDAPAKDNPGLARLGQGRGADPLCPIPMQAPWPLDKLPLDKSRGKLMRSGPLRA